MYAVVRTGGKQYRVEEGQQLDVERQREHRPGADAEDGARHLVRIRREPVARGGPFVMNTKEEIVQAFDDYRHNRF